MLVIDSLALLDISTLLIPFIPVISFDVLCCRVYICLVAYAITVLGSTALYYATYFAPHRQCLLCVLDVFAANALLTADRQSQCVLDLGLSSSESDMSHRGLSIH